MIKKILIMLNMMCGMNAYAADQAINSKPLSNVSKLLTQTELKALCDQLENKCEGKPEL